MIHHKDVLMFVVLWEHLLNLSGRVRRIDQEEAGFLWIARSMRWTAPELLR